MPPKVLVATFSAVPAPDRHGVFVDNVIRALSVRYELDVLSLRLGELPYVERYRRARMLRVPLAEGGLDAQVEAFRRAVRRQLASNDYDVIHLRSAWAALPVCRMRRELDAAVILDLTLSPSTQVRAADRNIVARTLSEEAHCMESADLVVVGSQGAKRRLLEGRPGLSVAVVPPGVDVDTFDWEPRHEGAGPLILYVGSIGPGRGIRLLLSALKLVLEQQEAELVLTGPVEDGFRPVLDEALERLGLSKFVAVTGPVDHEDVPRIIAAAAVCVVPTLPDPDDTPMGMCPFKLLEYLACRRPTVTPASAVVDEIFEGRPAVLSFEAKSPDDLARAIVGALQDRNEALASADVGYVEVRRRWTAAASRRALLDAYRRFAPYAPPLPSSVPVMSGVLPADPKTTTARRFAVLHDTVVQGAASRRDTGPSARGRGYHQRDTQPLVALSSEHPDLLSSSGTLLEVEMEEAGKDEGSVALVEAEVVMEGKTDLVDATSQTDPASGAEDGGESPAGDDQETNPRPLGDQDTVKLSLDVVSGTISGPGGEGSGSPD